MTIYHSNCIQKFSSSGEYICEFGTQGTGNGQFTNPHSVEVDGYGNIYVADVGNNRIQKFAYPASAYKLPDTGQTKCYNDTVEIACPSPGQDFYGQDAQYMGIQPSYTKLDADGNALPDSATSWVMVKDNVTGLIWGNKIADGSIPDPSKAYTWADAQNVFIAQLNASNFGGHNDWHLPNIRELASLADLSRYRPAINAVYFPDTKSDGYWSSSTYAFDNNYAWGVDFNYGNAIQGYKPYGWYVRAVRSSGSLRAFTNNGNGTVTDAVTGLTWQQATNNEVAITWKEALASCENLSLADYTDWRLPNIRELASLTEIDGNAPSIDAVFFPDTKSDGYWSSSTDAFNTSYAWGMGFSDGNVGGGYKIYGWYIRCVRGGMPPLPSPTITAVNPNNGTTAGGTAVTITGTNFAVGATVTFGGVVATAVNVTSATQITCTTPAHAVAGAVDVAVTVAGLSATKAGGFTYAASTYTIFGYVPDEYSTGISDVMLILDNGGGTVTTDSSGYFSVNVPSGWSGTVTPSKSDCTFTPESRSFSNLSSDQKLVFTGTCKIATAFTVSGMIWDINGTGLSDVALTFDNGGGTVFTDIFGFYSMTVSSGWSGTVTPYKSGCTFTPASQSFGSIIWNQWQDFTADGEPSWISRILPAAYMPGEEFTVTLEAEPPSGTNMYSAEDRCMNGWTVSGISDGGMYDRNTGKVKFGPFQDGKARTLTYSVTPPSSESKDGTFDGNGIINSAESVVGGQTVISKGLNTHPADMNADFTMSMAEMNTYGSAWLNFAPWTLPPNPIPMSYVSKAIELWLNGETYKYDPSSGSPPKCWVNTSSGRSAREDTPLTAARDLPSLYKAGTAITVTISVSASATGYTVEETLPSGWTASDMSDGGTAGGGFVRFLIPSAGGQAKTLTYQATPPSDAKGLYTFGGKISYSGNTPQTIAGDGAVSDTVPGDVNGDLKADLKDAVIALQIVAATQPPPTAAVGADVNSDGKIGVEEAVFALKESAE